MEYDLDVKLNSKGLFIYDTDNDRQIWSIPIAFLKGTRNIEGVVVSNIIHHLDEKKWISTKVLCKVAKIIIELFPDTEIDWNKTFLSVGRKLK